jgi:hypothetical protein
MENAMPEPISMQQLAHDLDKLHKQFSHYKAEVEKAVNNLVKRIEKLESANQFKGR